MNQSANVRSVESIQIFKVALTTFAEEAFVALSSVEMEIRRTRDWLQRDQLTHWQATVKRGNEQVSMARTELHRRRLSQQNSDAISDTEQKENLRHAQRRLEEAEDKVRRIKGWVPVLDHAIAEYHSASQPLGDRLTGSLQNSLALLNRIVASLDSYLSLTVPTSPEPSAAESSPRPAAAKSSATSSDDGDSTEDEAPDAAQEESATPEAATVPGEPVEGRREPHD
jgi:hypothetical protein